MKIFASIANHFKARKIKRTRTFPETVRKAWGEEHIMAYNEKYCMKRITLKAGSLTSLQFHEHKTETNYLAAGKGIYHWVDSYGQEHSKEITPGFFVTLPPGAVHRFEAITDIVLIEASTPEIWDVVRLQDAYGRAGTSAP